MIDLYISDKINSIFKCCISIGKKKQVLTGILLNSSKIKLQHMKFSLFLFTSLLATQLACAQPGLTAFAPPFFGAKAKQTFLFGTAVPEPGTGGADQNWDFSSVDFSVGTSTTVTLTNPTATTYSNNYLAATVAEVSTDGSITYFLYSSTEKTLLGTVSTGRKEIYSNTYKYAVAPFAFNTNQNDNFAYSFLYANSYPVTATGTLKTTYDGYGTLKTTLGTFSNVIRLKSEVSETDVISYSSTTSIETTNIGIVYSWIQPDKYFTLFSVSTNIATTFGSSTTSKQAILYEPFSLTTAIDESLPASIMVSPNPATDLVYVSLNNMTEASYEVRVYDATGILQYGNTFEKGNSTIDVSSFASGLYLMNIITPHGKLTKSFIKN